jgi:hypothetical protein
MSSRSRPPAHPDPSADLVRLDGEVERLSAWQAGHEDHCAERYKDTAAALESLREDIKGVRRDVGRIYDVLLKGGSPARAPKRTRLEDAKDLAQIVFQVVGTISGLGVVLWVAGGFFSWLGPQLEHLAGGFPRR